MVRYVRQRDTFRCGPIAILNALKWAGAPVTAALLPEITAVAGCVYPEGTQPKDFAPALRAFGEKYFSVGTVPLPSIRAIENCLREEDRAVLVNYGWFNRDAGNALTGHYTLFTGVSARGQRFTAVNFSRGAGGSAQGTTSTVSRAKMREFLHHRKDPEESRWYPGSWFLTKK